MSVSVGDTVVGKGHVGFMIEACAGDYTFLNFGKNMVRNTFYHDVPDELFNCRLVLLEVRLFLFTDFGDFDTTVKT